MLTKNDNSPGTPTPIAFVTHEYEPFRGGVATYVRELAMAAVRGHEQVEVLTVDYRGRFKKTAATGERENCLPSNESSGSVPVVRFPSDGRLSPAGLGRFAWGLWRARGRWQGGVVVPMSVGAQMVFFVLALWPGLVAVERCFPLFHGSEILRFARGWWRPLAQRFYARAGGFFATSRYVAGLLRDSGLLPPGAEITLVPCALPVAFAARGDSGERSEDGDYRVLTVARLHPRKGQLDVARALGRLPAEMRAKVVYQIVGVGDEDYRRSVEAACREGGLRVEFLGALDDDALARIYATATVYAQASRTLARSVEGFGLTFLEASFHGCAIAAYLSGGVGEAVLDGGTGLLVPEGDEKGLADSIRNILDDSILRAHLGERGKEFARSFRWENSAGIVCELVRENERLAK